MRKLEQPIFIGGSGRCGTSFLYSLIEDSEQCYGFTERETKFIICAHGLIDLYYALTHNFNESRAVTAIYRFKHLMNVLKTGKIFYETDGLETFFPNPKLYDDIVDEFLNSLHIVPKVPAYKSVEETIICFRTFLNTFFSNINFASPQKRFVEKTPHNFLHLKFLNELFPDLKFIHITRDPRGIVYSLTQQDWAPNDFAQSCLWLLQIYEGYINQDAFTTFTLQDLFLQIKLEDLCNDYEKSKQNIFSFLGLQNFLFTKKTPKIELVDYWKEKITKEQYEIADKILGKFIDYFGYY